jgi:hypothetical protein
VTYPIALGLLGLVPVVVALYLLRVRRRRRTVSTLLFWRKVIEEHQRRALFHRLRNLWSLLLNLAILICLILAATHLEWPGAPKEVGSTMVVLDNRARMQARDATGRTRLEVAKAKVLSLLRRANARNPVGLIVVQGMPETIAPLTDDVASLVQALNRVEPTDTAGQLEAAVRLSQSILASRNGTREILVVSDETPPSGDGSAAIAQIPLTNHSLDNLGIVGIEARPLVNDRQSAEVFVRVGNFSATRRTVPVELDVDRALFDVKSVELNPGEVESVIFTGVKTVRRYANSRGLIVARVSEKDALDSDNEAYAVLPEERPVRVLLVTKNNWFLENLLRADETVEPQIVSPDNFRPALAAGFEAVILDREIPPGVSLDSSGNYLFLGCCPTESTGQVDRPLLVETDHSHPLARFVDLTGTIILKARRLPAAVNGWTVRAPIVSSEGPLVLSLESSGKRRVIVGFDPADSDLPLRVAFPLLIRNALTWLSNKTDQPPVQFRCGESIELGPGVQVTKRPGDGPGPPLKSEGRFRPLRSGFYELANDPLRSAIAVNTQDTSQSDLRRKAPGSGAGETNSANSGGAPAAGPAALQPGTLQGWLVWPLWIYCGFLAIVLSGLEWWMYHQRRTE